MLQPFEFPRFSRDPLSPEEERAFYEQLAATESELKIFARPNLSVVDELIADRRLEAWREEVSLFEWLHARAS